MVATPARLICAGTARRSYGGGTAPRPATVAPGGDWGPAEVRDDIILGVNEALANCVEHAYRAHRTVGTMRLQATYDRAARSISVCVSDRGSWHRLSPQRPSDPRRSRGIMLMHALADHCTINARPNGTTVWLEFTTRP